MHRLPGVAEADRPRMASRRIAHLAAAPHLRHRRLKNWIVAFWHHPPTPRDRTNSDAETELIQMRQNALPILENYGVDLVLTGHSHSYERSYLLDGHYGFSNTLTSSMIKNSGSGRENGSGVTSKPTEERPRMRAPSMPSPGAEDRPAAAR